MMFDLIGGVKNNAYSTKPLTFLDPPACDDISTCLQISLLENGPRAPRDEWQIKQLLNLLHHTYANSVFWRRRLPSALSPFNALDFIPVLSRDDVNEQVNSEGSLINEELLDGVLSYPSSGSTGTPIKVFSMPQNARYNELRSMAQYFIEGRSLNANRTFIKPADGTRVNLGSSILGVDIHDGWIGSMGNIFNHGIYKVINFLGNLDPLIDELKKDPVGYLACLSSHMELLIKEGGAPLIRELNIKMWLHHSDNLDPHVREFLVGLGIPIRSSYSCSEVGPIAVECVEYPGNYHVAHSNVIVEEGSEEQVLMNNLKLHKLLITHLHSYATPLIKYDLGDFGKVHPLCPCGHDGATLSSIFGRKKHFLKSADGKLIPFLIFSKPLFDIVKFNEFFIYQPDFTRLVIELSGAFNTPSIKLEELKSYILNLSNGLFEVSITLVDKIDWGKNPKRLPFICYV